VSKIFLEVTICDLKATSDFPVNIFPDVLGCLDIFRIEIVKYFLDQNVKPIKAWL